jgi:hypothetical protein
MDVALKWPLHRFADKPFAHWIFPHIRQLLFVFNAIPHSMMKRLALPRPWLVQVSAAELGEVGLK